MERNVLVVGAGPVGLTMALELARYGVDVRIVEKRLERNEKSKALAIWSRTLELLARSGASETLVAAGNKVDGTDLTAGRTSLGHIELAFVDSPYNYVLLIPQNETERILEERLHALGISVERGVEITRFSTAPDRVSVTLSHVDGRIEELDSDWLVACDGAHSPVRHALGKTFGGDTIATDFMLADVHLIGENVPSPTRVSMFAHADGLLQFFPIHAARFRVIADIGPAHTEDTVDPTLADVQAVLDRRGPGALTAIEPIWLAAFRVNERQVEDYRADRVFLAGDAAHVHSPAGGQGMNTGMHDACNLAWKLAMVCSGACAAEPLLQSYSAERRPVAHHVIVESGRLTSLMTVSNPTLQAARNQVVRILFGLPPVRKALAAELSELEIGYRHGPLTRAGAAPPAGPSAGERAAQREPEGARDGASPPLFTLHAGAEAASIVTKFPHLLDPEIRPTFAPGGLWLVRPDGYIAVATHADNWFEVVDYLAAFTAGERVSSGNYAPRA